MSDRSHRVILEFRLNGLVQLEDALKAVIEDKVVEQTEELNGFSVYKNFSFNYHVEEIRANNKQEES